MALVATARERAESQLAARDWCGHRRNRLALVGLVVLVVLTAVAVAAPWLMPYDPLLQDVFNAESGPGARTGWAPTRSAATCCRA